jgi:hypothetical protein
VIEMIVTKENKNRRDKMTSRIEIVYHVSGGAMIEPTVCDNLNDAYDEFFRRIKLTRPLSESVIMIQRIEQMDDLIIQMELIHRVVLQ